MKYLFIYLIRFYQLVISPLKPKSCRFHPTCSEYSLEAFKQHGAIKGCILAVWRILRCNPFNKGGIDDVPVLFVPYIKSFFKKRNSK